MVEAFILVRWMAEFWIQSVMYFDHSWWRMSWNDKLSLERSSLTRLDLTEVVSSTYFVTNIRHQHPSPTNRWGIIYVAQCMWIRNNPESSNIVKKPFYNSSKSLFTGQINSLNHHYTFYSWPFQKKYEKSHLKIINGFWKKQNRKSRKHKCWIIAY